MSSKAKALLKRLREAKKNVTDLQIPKFPNLNEHVNSEETEKVKENEKDIERDKNLNEKNDNVQIGQEIKKENDKNKTVNKEQKEDDEDDIDPLKFDSKPTNEIKPESISALLNIVSDAESSGEEEEEEEEEKKEEEKKTSFIVRFIKNTPTNLKNTPTKEPDNLAPNNNERPEKVMDYRENPGMRPRNEESNLSKIIEEEKSVCFTPRTFREGQTSDSQFKSNNPSKIPYASSNNNKTFCLDSKDALNNSLYNSKKFQIPQRTKGSAKNLPSNKSFIKKINACKINSKFAKPKLAKAPQSFQSLSIKQRSLNLIKLGKKINETKQQPQAIPRKISMPELTEDQKVKMQVRIRQAKKKKMFTSRITSKRDKISSKIEELRKKYENNLIMKSMIDKIVKTVEFPEVSVFDEDVGNEEYQNTSTLKKVSSEEILSIIKHVVLN